MKSDHAGPPDHARSRAVERGPDDELHVSDPVADAEADVDWSQLSPFQQWVVAVLDREGLI